MALSQLVEVQGLANNERGSGGGNIAMFALQAGLKQVGVPQSWMVSAIAENPSPFQLVSGGSSCFARQFCFWPLLLSLLAEGAIGFPKSSLLCVPGTSGRCCWVWIWVWGWVGQDTALYCKLMALGLPSPTSAPWAACSSCIRWGSGRDPFFPFSSFFLI